jgi:RNA polymerase sigma-70 factor (ECF subfamily)
MHEATSLAFITALQLLPPRQRAVHILRDVLGFQAKEVADILESTEESVASALKRARATLRMKVAAGDTDWGPPTGSASDVAIAEEFARAFESDHIEALIRLLTEQVCISMPPLPLEWVGRAAARQVLQVLLAPGRLLLRTRANGQPTFGLYLPDRDARVLRAVGLLVLTLAGDQVSAITRFEANVLSAFDLPAVMPDRPL